MEDGRTEGSPVIGDRGHAVVSHMPDIVGEWRVASLEIHNLKVYRCMGLYGNVCIIMEVIRKCFLF